MKNNNIKSLPIFERIRTIKDIELKDEDIKKSLDWYRKYIQSNIRNTKMNMLLEETTKKYKLEIGKMYLFEYNAINKDLYYDKYPLMIPISIQKSKDKKYYMTGFNFHYLKPMIRQKLFLLLYDYKDNRLKLAKELELLLKYHKEYQIGLKNYRLDMIMSNLMLIEEKDYEICIFLPLAKFK